MKTNFDIEELVKDKQITNELDYERALIADRKLRLLAMESIYFKKTRKKLRDLIEDYENRVWANIEDISEEQIVESEQSDLVAESERIFVEKRKNKIKKKLKILGLSQENLALILGHKSKTYMSELINGIKPFTIKDLIVINRLLEINIKDLIPTFLSISDQTRIKEAVIEIDNPNLKLSNENLALTK